MKKQITTALFLGIFLFLTMITNAQVTLVKDIQTAVNKNGSNPDLFKEYNGYLYFTANEPSIGTELWRTNGTSAGTELVKDIRPGTGSSSPTNFIVYKGYLYFQADDGATGTELWRTDGTYNGTELVMDIYPGSSGGWGGGFNSSRPQNFIIYKDTLFFQARDNNGTELWKSDGTDSGTVMVKNIYTGSGGGGGANSSSPQFLTKMKVGSDTLLFFSAASNSIGTELWKSNGTSAGTILVKDINSGTNGSSPKQLIVFKDKLYFVATDGANGDEFWVSDGTAGGTSMVKDILSGASGSAIGGLTVYNNQLYFAADNGTGGELWTSDGTSAGTKLFKDINTLAGYSASNPGPFVVFNGKMYFAASDGFVSYELWECDGTSAGTKLFKDINNGSVNSSPDLFTISNGTLYFVAINTGVGNELWKSDGTATVMVRDISSGTNSSNPRGLTAFKGELYFSADDGVNSPQENREPWKSNGTSSGTTVIKELVSGTKPSSPSQMVRMKTNIYFVAESATDGRELFKSDGTTAGTTLVRQIMSGIYGSDPRNLINANDVLYFSASDGTTGYELYKSGGTSATTTRLGDINPGPYDSDPSSLCNVNGIVYFAANDGGTGGVELWKTDGTTAGTVMVKDIFPGLGTNGVNSSNPSWLTNVNGTLYFSADDGVHGTELWKSDGTDAGTVLVKDIRYGADSSDISNLFNYNGKLLFQANDGVIGTELWWSGGYDTATMMVKDIYPGKGGWGGTPNSSNPQGFCELNGKSYFQATSTVGTELWQTDGTDTGTKLVKDIEPSTGWGGARSSTPQNLTKVGSEIFFTANTRADGTELWKTNGTTAGTVMFRNINPGSKSSNPSYLTADGTNLYFVANDGTNGSELWKAENNQCGKTQMSGQTNPGSSGTGPTNLCVLNSTQILFAGTNASYSTELWKYNYQFTYADTAKLTYTICNGDTVTINGKYYTKAGNYRDSLNTATMCDSLILATIIVNPTYTNTKVYKRCLGDSVKVGNNYIKTSGTYSHDPKTYKGCDSVLIYNLTFTPKPTTPVITKTGTIQLTSSADAGNQWYDDNGKIANATQKSYTTNGKPGKFYVIVTIDSCSSDPSNKMNPLGINEKQALMNVDIYPNPVTDKLIIECDGNKEGSFYYINDLQGKTMIQGKLSNSKTVIDVNSLPGGIYFVKIIYNDQIGLIKILKE